MPKPRQPSSFKNRLAVAMCAHAICIIALANIAVYIGVRQSLRNNLDDALISITRGVVSSAVDYDEGPIHIHEPDDWQMQNRLGYIEYAQIVNLDKHIIARTHNLAENKPLPINSEYLKLSASGKPGIHQILWNMQPLRVIYYPLKDNYYVAMVAISEQPLNHSLLILVIVQSISFVVALVAGLISAYRIAGLKTHPLQLIAASARQVSEDHLNARVPILDADKELMDVTNALNDMLHRLDEAFNAHNTLLQAQRRFVADASHELRSPLSNIKGTIEVTMRRSRSVDDYKETLHIAMVEVDRLCRLVDDLLTLSRADTGHFRINPGPCDIIRIINQSIQFHSARAKEACVNINLDSPVRLILCADEDRLRQVIDNLLDNAIRHCPQGNNVVITVKEESTKAIISVYNPGMGIDPKDIPHIFDRFYRTDASRARFTGGSGLGLAIVKTILTAHNGIISVDSKLGEGTTFIAEIPIIGIDTDEEDMLD